MAEGKKLHRTLRIPASVRRAARRDPGTDAVWHVAADPLWHVGELTAENGRDIEFEPLEDQAVTDAQDTPLEVRPTGVHPGSALDEPA